MNHLFYRKFYKKFNKRVHLPEIWCKNDTDKKITFIRSVSHSDLF